MSGPYRTVGNPPKARKSLWGLLKSLWAMLWCKHKWFILGGVVQDPMIVVPLFKFKVVCEKCGRKPFTRKQMPKKERIQWYHRNTTEIERWEDTMMCVVHQRRAFKVGKNYCACPHCWLIAGIKKAP